MCVRTAHVKAIAVSHRLYHSYMISAVEMLEEKEESEILNSVVRHVLTVRKLLHSA